MLLSIAKSAEIGNITGVGTLLSLGSPLLSGSGLRPSCEKSLVGAPEGPSPLAVAVLF